jgi:ferritin
MTVEDWTLEAVEALGRSKDGATLRQLQRYIDERHYEELAVDTLEAALAKLESDGRIEKTGSGWKPAHKTSKEDALKKLFGE